MPESGADPTVDQALAVLASMVLPDGRRWGEAATALQWSDARAVLTRSGPRRHWLGRARGYSKTTDVAAMAIAAMLCQLPRGAMAYAAAADADQARLLLNAMRGFWQRTPELRGQITVQASRVIAERTGAILEVLSADAASAYGLTPYLLFIDELCQWPKTTNAREFYVALTSAIPKVEDARSVVMTTAGDPAHWSRRIYDHAAKSPMWRVSEVSGPAPWQRQEEIDEQESALMPSTFRRLFHNEWVASEDRLVDPDDLTAAMVLSGPVPPVWGRSYVIGVDIGLKKDKTVVVVAHRKKFAADKLGVVVDHLWRAQGTRENPVQLSQVERAVADLSTRYNRAPAYVDPWQAMGTVQRLQARGVRAVEWPFTSQSTGRLAHGLFTLLRDRKIDLPIDQVLRDELLGVRMRETSPGLYRMDHDASGHDDQAVAIALAAHNLLTVDLRPRVKAGFRATSYI